MKPSVRATIVLIEDGSILLVRQKVSNSIDRCWSLPGGKVELGETLAECIVREAKEESGLDVAVEKLLYVCDRIVDGKHTIHLTFLVRRVGGALRLGAEPEAEAYPITDSRMVPIKLLGEYEFSDRFRELAAQGFPNAGSYMGLVSNIGL